MLFSPKIVPPYTYIYNPLSTHTHNNNKKMDPPKKFMGISLFLLQFQGTKTPFSPFSLFTVWNQKKKRKEKKSFLLPKTGKPVLPLDCLSG